MIAMSEADLPFATINPAHLQGLCPELRILLDAELTAGNRVVETGEGWPNPSSILVMLALPFRCTPSSLPRGVEYLEVNDTHWWKAEYHHLPTSHLLACRF
jgi:hypothetical protein